MCRVLILFPTPIHDSPVPGRFQQLRDEPGNPRLLGKQVRPALGAGEPDIKKSAFFAIFEVLWNR